MPLDARRLWALPALRHLIVVGRGGDGAHEYEPLLATGVKGDMICAFARRDSEAIVVVVSSRFPLRFDADPRWCDTAIPLPQNSAVSRYRNVLTGTELSLEAGSIQAEAAFEGLPVAVLLG